MITDETAMQARKDIFEFVVKVHDFLREIISKPIGEAGLLFIEPMLPELLAAWTEFTENFQIQKAEQLVFRTSAVTLQAHGLYGTQLRAKLSLVRFRFEQFSLHKTKKALLKLIDAIDTLLSSILSATGIDEALKELKELLRDSVDDE